MKLFNKLIIALFIVSALAFNANAEAKLVPYYSLNVGEGIAVPNKGEYLFGLNLTNDIGLLFSPTKESDHRILAFYELKYVGPGLHKQEGEKFSDRWMDHISMLRYNYSIDKYTAVKVQLDYMIEYKRTGTNEVWGNGLYDFTRTGFVLGVSRTFLEKLETEFNYGYHSLDFPNYTDLLAEFQSGGGATAESSAGKQNNTMSQFGISAKYGNSRAFFDSTSMPYDKQKVITETKQTDGTYYSAALQKDTILSFGVSHTQKLFNFVLVSPALNYKIKNSNQNFQNFATATSTVPVQYFGNYYGYTEYSFELPLSLLLSRKWEFNYTLEYNWKDYVDRQPRDSDGNFVDGKQHNYLSIMSVGFTYKPNEVTRTTFFYSYQAQTSNMKFEKYLPYNYDGHYFGINFNYTY